jgi:hypothetical protein
MTVDHMGDTLVVVGEIVVVAEADAAVAVDAAEEATKHGLASTG